MARNSIPPKEPAPIITLQRSEFDELRRTLHGIASLTLDAFHLMHGIDARAANEFAESMRIIRGLPPEKGGDQ
jgi:hypothetical protein